MNNLVLVNWGAHLKQKWAFSRWTATDIFWQRKEDAFSSPVSLLPNSLFPGLVAEYSTGLYCCWCEGMSDWQKGIFHALPIFCLRRHLTCRHCSVTGVRRNIHVRAGGIPDQESSTFLHHYGNIIWLLAIRPLNKPGGSSLEGTCAETSVLQIMSFKAE